MQPPTIRLHLPAAALALLLAGGLALAWLTREAPIEPGRARGLLRADALSALAVIAAAGQGLVSLALRRDEAHGAAEDAPAEPAAALPSATFTSGGHGAAGLTAPPWRIVAGVLLVAAAALSGHLGATGLLLLVAAALQVPPRPPRAADALRLAGRRGGEGAAAAEGGHRPRWMVRLGMVPTACVALGLGLIGVAGGGEWRYGVPAAGQGMNSVSLVLLLLGALLAAGAAGLVADGRRLDEGGGGNPGAATADQAAAALATVGALYALLRMFSLGPWNLGWLLAALLGGGAVALWAAWLAAAAAPGDAARWVALALAGTAVAGAGLASGAGVTLAGFALLLGPVLRLGLTAPRPARAHWLLSAAVPLSGPFVLAWMAVAAALAGGVTVLAAALWAAALLAALPPARLGLAGADPVPAAPRTTLAAAGLSAALGLGAPLVVGGLLQPVAAQLRGGLTPFGEIELWPWAGLIAFDAARQPAATLPSLALVALMLILVALCWVALRVARRP